MKAQRIDDPLEARGFGPTRPDAPVVLLALDWCEVRNGAYDLWRDTLAAAAKTSRERVLVCSLHHTGTVVDEAAWSNGRIWVDIDSYCECACSVIIREHQSAIYNLRRSSSEPACSSGQSSGRTFEQAVRLIWVAHSRPVAAGDLWPYRTSGEGT